MSKNPLRTSKSAQGNRQAATRASIHDRRKAQVKVKKEEK